jgi:ABC-type nitrate/sulfonate/bicarbonate transport system permease component
MSISATPRLKLRASAASGSLEGSLWRRPRAADLEPRKFARRRRVIELTLAWLIPIALIGIWQWVAESGWINQQFFPAPSAIWSTGVDMVRDGRLQDNLWVSLKRILIGFAFGAGAGVVAGLFMGVSRTLRAALDPLMNALYTVPKLALLPLFLLIFGLGETPKIILISINVFFLVWLTTMASFMSVSPGYLEAARAFGANPWQMFRHALLPAALPDIFTALRIAIGASVLVVVGIEFVQASNGIGWFIWNSWSLFEAKEMYVGIVVVALLGVVLTYIIQLIRRLVLPWTRAENGGSGS